MQEELRWHGFAIEETGDGWVKTPEPATVAREMSHADLCFPHFSVARPTELQAESLNAQAAALTARFGELHRNTHFTQPWPLVVEATGHDGGLQRRARNLQRVFLSKLASKLARVAKLAVPARPKEAGNASGWAVFLLGLNRVCLSPQFVYGGQHRMADAPEAPSRSYLKVEEAYRILGRGVKAGETVTDLGAAPGGWSYSAAKRGAHVLAVDNGPLKKGAGAHPRIRAHRANAFYYTPGSRKPTDWLFCDTLEEPNRVLALLRRWLDNRWCRHFVVNIKFGHLPPIAILRRIYDDSENGIARYCRLIRCRHLYHNREELTVLGSIKA